MSSLTLDQWLVKLENQHPVEIDLGLERIQKVAHRLNLESLPCKVVTVAGTNGKGSCVRALEYYLLASGLNVGSYTSPHLIDYNERIRLNGYNATDQDICQAFETIARDSKDISLTYFEVGTLAAFLILAKEELDVVILEVGLGGRYDAVNLIDADIAVITSIAIDHSSWLGTSREEIAQEKSGIARRGKPVVCADENPPESLKKVLKQLDCEVAYIQKDFGYSLDAAQGMKISLQISRDTLFNLDAVPVPNLPIASVVAALQVGCALHISPVPAVIKKVCSNAALPGRFQQMVYKERAIILDVAHNPAAAQYLAKKLTIAGIKRAAIVAALMADKDVDGFIEELLPLAEHWYLGFLFNVPRAMSAVGFESRIKGLASPSLAETTVAASIEKAFELAVENTGKGEVIVVCGSFFTVAAILALIQRQ